MKDQIMKGYPFCSVHALTMTMILACTVEGNAFSTNVMTLIQVLKDTEIEITDL